MEHNRIYWERNPFGKEHRTPSGRHWTSTSPPELNPGLGAQVEQSSSLHGHGRLERSIKYHQMTILQTSSQCWWLPSAKVVQKTNNPTVTPSTLGWSLQYLLFENCFSCIWDLSNSWGCKWISSIWKPFCGTLWVPSWNIIFYLKSVFQYSSNIFYLKNKLHCRLSSIWKVVWITIPQSKKLKNPWFLNSFSPTPPEGESAKVPPAGSHFGRYFGTLLFEGVTQVRASMFYWF